MIPMMHLVCIGLRDKRGTPTANLRDATDELATGYSVHGEKKRVEARRHVKGGT